MRSDQSALLDPSCGSMKRKDSHQSSPRDAVRAVVLTAISEVLSLPTEEISAGGSFLAYGGTSLSAIEACSRCRSDGVQLHPEDILASTSLDDLLEKARVAPSPIFRSSKRRKLSSSQVAQDACLANGLGTAPCLLSASILAEDVASPNVSACSRSRESTEMQRVFAMDSRKRPGTNIIRVAQTFETRHVPALKAAWQRAIEMEYIFQSDCDSEWSEQTCSTEDELALVLEDVPKYSSVVSKFSTVTVDTSPEHTTIIWDVHHALIDGYSAMLLYQKVRHLAEGLGAQPGTAFVEVAQDLKLLQQQRAGEHKQFWEQQKSLHPHAKGKLHIEQSRPDPKSAISPSIALERRAGLQSWCSAHNVTLAALHYSVWSLVLSTYVDSDSVVFGTVVSGRGLSVSGADDTIGPLVNTLPFFVNIDWSMSGEEHVRKIFEQMLKWQEVESSSPKEGFSRDFDSAIAMEIEMPSFDGFKIQAVDKSSFNVQTGIPLSISFNASGQVKFRYQPHQFNAQDIQLLSKQYDSWLAALTTSNQTLEDCMSQISHECYGGMVLEGGNLGLESTMLSSIKEDLVTLFEKMVDQHPDVVAVQRKEKTLTYAEMDRSAGRLAHYMKTFVQAGDVVCVYADRSINWLIAAYAVLKLGAVYAPLNLALPTRTREINYRTAKAVLYLTPHIDQKESAPAGARTLSVEEVLEAPASDCVPHRTTPQPASPAYVCFTSGSTGTPKGVLCRHCGLVAFQKDLTVRLNAQPGQKISQIMSPAFDGSIHEIFSALSYGGTLVLPGSANEICHLEECHSAILTPSLARVLRPNDYPRLRQVYFVGEPVPQPVCDDWASSKRVFNMYGPTESTCGATIKELHPTEPVTIGKPNPSSRMYILDRHRRPCPPNVIGDMYTAGVQVAVGYLGLAELNASRFLPDPFCPGTEEKMYFTGDRGCWTAAGEVKCFGRSDRQIKLNGFRLDLNLLEEQILEDNPELAAVGLVKKHDFLQAAVAPGSIDTIHLRSQLAEKLPLYAVPRHLFSMDALPKTAISKVDYSAIEALESSPSTPEPTSELQKMELIIERLWKEILNLDRKTTLCRRSTLLELGGDSLTQLTLADRLSQTLGRPVHLRQVIEAPTLHDLAVAVHQSSRESSDPGNPHCHVQSVSSLEADWIKKYETGTGTSAFNVSVAWQFTPNTIDREKLAEAWNTVLARNSIFSTYYVDDDVRGSSRAYHKCPPRAELVDRFNLPEILNTPFQVKSDRLVRVLISHSMMLVVISHILCDLTTLRIVLKDVASLYSNPSADPALRTSGQCPTEQEDICQTDLDYWSQTLATAPPLQTWRDVPARQTFEGKSDARWLPRSLLQDLTGLARAEHVTLHHLALAATALTLQHDRSSTDIVLGAPFMNRRSEELVKTGLFLEPLPIRICHDAAESDGSVFGLLNSVRQASQSALAHRIPWSRLLQHLDVSCAAPHNPFFDVMVTFHDLRQEELLPIAGLQQLHSWSAGSKFKLMVELSAYDDESLLLRLEYDPQCFSPADIERIHGLMARALTQLTTDSNISDLCQTMHMQARDTSNRSDSRAVHVGSLIRTA